MRNGGDVVIQDWHSSLNVYGEMLGQICRDYSGLPDYRTLGIREIVWFYDRLRPELVQATKGRSDRTAAPRARRPSPRGRR